MTTLNEALLDQLMMPEIDNTGVTAAFEKSSTSMNEAEWLSSKQPEPMLERLRTVANSRRLRLSAVAFCRRIWGLLLDERSRRAVELLEQHIEGNANDDELREAGLKAEEAYHCLKQPWRRLLGPILRPELRLSREASLT